MHGWESQSEVTNVASALSGTGAVMVGIGIPTLMRGLRHKELACPVLDTQSGPECMRQGLLLFACEYW
jgi:hypothetical protein